MALSDLVVFQKAYDFLLWVKPTVERFAKVHKYSIGSQLQGEALELLKAIARANVKRDKAVAIEECVARFEAVKILVRLCKDFQLLSIKQYEFASRQLDEIGRLLYGWQKKFQ